MKRVLLFSLVALFLSCKGSLQSVILRGPRSRIVPRGAVATFKCVFQNPRNPHWRVNDIDYNEHQIQYFRSRGFFVEPNQQDSSGAEILTLRVDSSFGGVNNTAIFCRDFGPISSDATSIIVINDSPLSPHNFDVNQQNSSLIVQWSPPFLWPGSAIDHYNVSVTNSNSSITHHRIINASYTSRVVRFEFTQEQAVGNCAYYTFGITPVVESMELGTVSVNGGFATHIDPQNISASTSVLFTRKSSPAFLRLLVELPDSVCSFQEVNYEVFILDNNGALALPASQSKQHVGPGRVVDYIPVPGLAEGQNYTARMEISSAAGNLTRELLFNTSFETGLTTGALMPGTSTVTMTTTSTNFKPEIEGALSDTYKIIAGVFIVLFTVILIILFLGTLVYFRRRFRNNKTRIRQPLPMQHLVPNPIYDGPLYDTVQPKFETLENSIFRNPTTKDEVEMNSEPYLIPTTGSHTKEPNTIRYVDQPQSLQSAFSASVVSNQTQTNGMVKEAAKDSGQCVENTSSVTENLKAPLESVDGCLNDPSPALLEQPSLQCLMGVEETYTQMNPSGTITFSLTGGLGEVTKN